MDVKHHLGTGAAAAAAAEGSDAARKHCTDNALQLGEQYASLCI